MRRLACCLLVPLVMLGFVRPVAASDAGLTNTETFSGFQFNFNNPGARALGMGGAFVAVADDATAVVANPAGLTILQRPEISAEYKYARFKNTINAFTNTPDDAATNTVRSRDFTDSVNTPSFFSFVYPTERVVLAAFVRELINYKSTFDTNGVFLTDPTNGTIQRLSPVKSDLEITALNFGLGAGVNLEKENPFLPNIGVSLEFSFGHINSRLQRFDTLGPTGPPNFSAPLQTEGVDGTDLGIGVNVGLLWHPTKDLSFGAVYRRGPKYDMTFVINNNISGATSSLPFGFKVPDVYAAGAAYRFFERLTVAFEATYIRYSQLVEHFQVPLSDTIATQYKLDDKVELHIGAEYIFFIKNIPLAARGGFYTNPDHKIKYEGPLNNASAVGERLIYAGGKDRYQGTAGLGIVPFPGFQLDFAGNYGKDLLEFSVSSVLRF
jgi:long-chain fatty acid transport protein